jgi:hypothetical protein
MTARSSHSDAELGTDRGSPPRVPRWLWVSGIIVVLVILAVVAIMLFGGGSHGPERFGPGGH